MKIKTFLVFLSIFILESCGSFYLQGGWAYNTGNYEQRDKKTDSGRSPFIGTGWYTNKVGDGIGVQLDYMPTVGYLTPIGSTNGFGTAELKYRKIYSPENSLGIGYSLGLGGGLELREGGASSFRIACGSGELSFHPKKIRFFGLLKSKHYLNLSRLQPTDNGAYNHSIQAGIGIKF